MKNSHTLSLIEETFEKIQEFNYKRYIKELENISQEIHLRGLKAMVNQILGKFGLHLTYKSKIEELDCSRMGKWSSVGTFQLAFKNPEKFDEIYNKLPDEDSKSTFDWFIKCRVAYAFLGELAGEVFPPKITKDEFFRGMNDLKFDRHNGVINAQNYCFSSEALAVLWKHIHWSNNKWKAKSRI
jgi:hypothetical protein